MKLWKKILAWVATIAMVFSMNGGISALAADRVAPSKDDTGTITVTGITEQMTVTAYHIVGATYNDVGNAFTGYTSLVENQISNPLSPTSTEMLTLSKLSDEKLNKLDPHTMNWNENGTYTATVSPGYWMILVTGTSANGTIYNPMLAGLYYSVSGSDNTMTNESINATEEWKLVSKGAYAKSSTPKVDKTVKDRDDAMKKAVDAQIGRTVTYQVKATVPSYIESTDKTFTVSDTLKGLTFAENLALNIGLKKGDNTVSWDVTSDTDYLTVSKTDTSFKLTFTNKFLQEYGNYDITITYDATVSNTAEVNFDPNTNKATVTYSAGGETKTTESEAKVYTLQLNGEIHKKDENNDPLMGAEFTMKKLNSDGTEVDNLQPIVATSDASGNLIFTGLEAGLYSLKETKTPDGYADNGQVYLVDITAKYNTDRTQLESFNVDIWTQTDTNNYTKLEDDVKTFTVTADGAGSNSSNPINFANSFQIANTTIGSLPSTGGIGTYLFTIGGISLMTVAAALFLVNRKTKQQSVNLDK